MRVLGRQELKVERDQTERSWEVWGIKTCFPAELILLVVMWLLARSLAIIDKFDAIGTIWSNDISQQNCVLDIITSKWNVLWLAEVRSEIRIYLLMGDHASVVRRGNISNSISYAWHHFVPTTHTARCLTSPACAIYNTLRLGSSCCLYFRSSIITFG